MLCICMVAWEKPSSGEVLTFSTMLYILKTVDFLELKCYSCACI